MKSIWGISAAFLIAFGSTSALANDSFTLTNNSTGATYLCAPGSGAGPSEPACVSKLTDWCYDNLGLDHGKAYDQAVESCRGQGDGTEYLGCVAQTTDYCYRNTGYSRADCGEKALKGCRSGVRAETLIDFMRGAKERAIKSLKRN